MKWDTVIIDDANLLSESDVLQTIKHGAYRLVLVGNRMIEQKQFMLHARPDRTLYQRIIKASEKTPDIVARLEKSWGER
jgi:hypothetical protein